MAVTEEIRERTDDTRERLLEAAGPIFAEKGFRAATVREICARAGVNLAAVNYHFWDKEKLYIESVRRAHQHPFVEVPLPQWPADTPPDAKLAIFIKTVLTRMLEVKGPAWHLQLMMREMLQPTGACTELIRDFLRPHFEMLMGVLDEVLPAEMPMWKRHLVGFSIIGQCLHYKMAKPIMALLVEEGEFGRYDVECLAGHIVDFTFAALGLRPAVGRREEAP